MDRPADERALAERDLFDRCRQGDSAAWDQVHQRYERRVLFWIRARATWGVDSEAISQETWLRVVSRLDTFDGENFGGWVCTIAEHLLADEARKYNVRKRHGAQVVVRLRQNGGVEPVAKGESSMKSSDDIEDERLAAMRACLQSLDSVFVATIRRNKLDGLSPEVIAKNDGVSVGAVYTRINRGKEQLEECIHRKLSQREPRSK